jgi:hypothetical protein
MAEAVREQALAAIATKLAAMTGTRPWGGSYADNPVVDRIYHKPENVTQFPHVCVIEGALGSTFDIEATGGAQAAQFLHAFKVAIYGYVKGDLLGGTPRSTWLQRLWDDVVKTLLANATLDGAVRDLTLDPGVETDEGELEPVGVFVQLVTVEIDEMVTVA